MYYNNIIQYKRQYWKACVHAVLSALHTLTHLVKPICERYYHVHFTEKIGTEGISNFSVAHSWQMAELRIILECVAPPTLLLAIVLCPHTYVLTLTVFISVSWSLIKIVKLCFSSVSLIIFPR